MATVRDAEGYARDVVRGRVPAGKWVRLACRRHMDDLKRWGRRRRADRPYWFDREAAEKVLRWFARVPVHVKGELAGQPLALQPWQAFQVAVVFGWRRSADGTRRFRTGYTEVPRKQGKSLLAAGLALYLTTSDGEPGAEVYSAATTGDQAEIVWKMAARMRELSTPLRRRLEVYRGKPPKLYYPRQNATFQPINAKSSTQEGLDPHGAVIDEYHAHRTRELFDVVRTGRGARRQPLVWIITTAGSNVDGPCHEERDYVCKVLEGVLDDESYFGYVACIDEGDDWRDETCWPKANPNLGVSARLDTMREEAQRARQSASAEAVFQQRYLGVWVGSLSPWMPMELWRACGDARLRVEDFAGCEAWLAADLATVNDVAALSVWVRRYEAEQPVLRLFHRFYLPADAVDPEATGAAAHYADWAAAGHLTLTPGPVIDQRVIQDDVRALAALLDVREVGYDPFQAAKWATELSDDGLDVVQVPQTVKALSQPMKELMGLVLAAADAGKAGRPVPFAHDANPVETWMMSNVQAHEDHKENIYPRKEKKGSRRKIDGPVADIMGLSRVLAAESARSVYEERGIREV